MSFKYYKVEIKEIRLYFKVEKEECDKDFLFEIRYLVGEMSFKVLG